MSNPNLRLLRLNFEEINSSDGRLTFSYIMDGEGRATKRWCMLNPGRTDEMISQFSDHWLQSQQIYMLSEKPTMTARALPDVQRREIEQFFSGIIESISKEDTPPAAQFVALEQKRGQTRKRDISENGRVEMLLREAQDAIDLRDDFERARDALVQVLRLAPNHAQAHREMASVVAILDGEEAAIPHFERARELTGDSQDAIHLAFAYLRTGHLEEARTEFRGLLVSEPENKYAIGGGAQIHYLRREQFVEGLDQLAELDAKFLIHFIRDYWEFRRPDTAARCNPWPLSRAARYLGHSDTSQFKREILALNFPRHYDTDRRFFYCFRDEIDDWLIVVNRYRVYDRTFRTNEREARPQARRKGRMSAAERLRALRLQAKQMEIF